MKANVKLSGTAHEEFNCAGEARAMFMNPLLWILCDTLARWLEAVSSTLVEMVTLARKLPGRQEVLPCCGEDVVDIEHWRLGGQHTQINRRVCTAEYAGAQTTVVSQR